VIVATASNDIDEIRREMAQLRINLHHDMRGVVAGAEAATDWRSYVQQYPWVCLGVAVGVGYLLVPGRRRSVRATADAAATAVLEKVKDANVEQVSAQSPSKGRRSGLFGLIFPIVAPVVVRAVQAYAAQYVENLLASQAKSGPARPSATTSKNG
jgi:hypothetical protein